MATRLFLRNTAALFPPTAGEKSTALPAGTANNQAGKESLALSLVKGPAEQTTGFSTLAQTGLQNGLLQRHTSPKLAAQTISANTWTFYHKALESNANANILSVGSIYVWRPGTNSVVGYIYDSSATIDIGYRSAADFEWNNNPAQGGTGTVSGASVVAAAEDVLVYEVWYSATQSMGSTYTGTFYYAGTNDTDIADGTTNASAAAFIETPQNLTFFSTPATYQFLVID